MNLVYVLVPLMQIDSKEHIIQKTKEILMISTDQSQPGVVVHQILRNKFAVELKDFNLHFLEINQLLEEFDELKRKNQILQSVIKEYEPEPAPNEEHIIQNPDSLLKKVKKYKELKQENKKLKKLLQLQLQNTEKVREETQKTMKVLREEFDALVFEMSKKQKTLFPSGVQFNYQSQQQETKQYQHKQKINTSTGGKHVSIR